MFRAENTNVSTTSVSEQQPTESTHGDTPRHTLPTTEDAATEETHIVTETVPETPTDTSPALDLDDLHIDDTPASSEP